MNKLLIGLILILASLGMIYWGHGNIFWIGVGILSFIGLSVFCLITYLLVKFIKWSGTLLLYDILTITTLSILNIRGIVSLNVVLTTAIPLTAVFLMIVVRFMGYHAQTSVIWSEIFSWVTGYKIKSYIIVNKRNKTSTVISRDKVLEDSEEQDNIQSALKSLGYTTKEAKEATRQALKEKDGEPIEEKIKYAISYLSAENMVDNIS